MVIYSGFNHKTWWFSIVMLVYQRVCWTFQLALIRWYSLWSYVEVYRAQDQVMEVQGEKEHKQMLKLLKQEPDTWRKTPLDWPLSDVDSCGVNRSIAKVGACGGKRLAFVCIAWQIMQIHMPCSIFVGCGRAKMWRSFWHWLSDLAIGMGKPAFIFGIKLKDLT